MEAWFDQRPKSRREYGPFLRRPISRGRRMAALGSGPRRCDRIAGMTAFGASRPLPRVPAKVPWLNRERALSLGDGNRSSCPFPAIWPPPGGLAQEVGSRHSFPAIGRPRCAITGFSATGVRAVCEFNKLVTRTGSVRTGPGRRLGSSGLSVQDTEPNRRREYG